MNALHTSPQPTVSMSPVTRELHINLLRAVKMAVKAWERWLIANGALKERDVD